MQAIKSRTDRPNPLVKAPDVARVTLPHYLNTPSSRRKLPSMPLVSSDIGCELGGPVIATRLRTRRQLAARMLMPEAAVNKDDEPMPWQHDVRLSGQIASMQPKPKSSRMKRSANNQLWLCPRRPNAGHQRASFTIDVPEIFFARDCCQGLNLPYEPRPCSAAANPECSVQSQSPSGAARLRLPA